MQRRDLYFRAAVANMSACRLTECTRFIICWSSFPSRLPLLADASWADRSLSDFRSFRKIVVDIERAMYDWSKESVADVDGLSGSDMMAKWAGQSLLAVAA